MPLSEDTDGLISEFKGVYVKQIRRDLAKSTSKLVDEILLENNVGIVSPMRILMDNWGKVIPEKFAQLCEPSDMGKTVIYIRAANSSAKQELIFQERQILEKIKSLGGFVNIKKIKFL